MRLTAPSLAVLWACTLASPPVCAQSYPTKPIRIITSEPGGSNDFLVRAIAPSMAVGLGQPVLVDNRAGNIAVETVAKAPPDGYTLLSYGSVIWLSPFLRDVPWDPIKDFAPITLCARSPNILIVHPSLPVKTVKELITLAKNRPGQLNYSSATDGSATQLAAELFKSMAGVNIVRVAYRGNGPALVALTAGEVQVMFPAANEILGYLKTQRLRALAVASGQRSALAPELPTMAEAGLPGFESASTSALLAPGGTPATIVARLNQEAIRVLGQPESRDRFLKNGLEVVANTPEQFSAAIRADMTKMGKVIKDAGIRSN